MVCRTKCDTYCAKGEGVSTAQLMLLLEGLGHTAPQPGDEPQSEFVSCSPDAAQADEDLRTAAGFGDGCGGQAPAVTKPPPQPSLRKPFPEQLDRVEQLIAVPEEQRPCPVCGKPRDCIGHDITETAELEPAKIIIRVEKREKLACHDCEAEVVRAPIGDRVVRWGKIRLATGRADSGRPMPADGAPPSPTGARLVSTRWR